MHSPLRFIPHIFRKSSPIHLTLFLTSRCNARCGFCFAHGRKTAQSDELTLDEITRLSASMGSLLWLAFSGGEPYLRDDLAGIAEVLYRQNRPSIILLPTNGLLPAMIREKTEAILRACPESVIAVKLSVDGIGERHDALRGVAGAFSRVIETYGALEPLLREFRNFELGVNTVFCAENQDSMDEINNYVARAMPRIRTHTISLVRGAEAAGRIDPARYLMAVESLERSLKEGSSPIYGFRGASIKASQDIIQRRMIHRTITEGRAIMPCHAGRLNVTVMEDGETFPCESFTARMSMGNVRDHVCDLGALLGTERAKDVIGEIKQGGCFCTHECYMMTNILFNPGFYPRLLAGALRIGRGV